MSDSKIIEDYAQAIMVDIALLKMMEKGLVVRDDEGRYHLVDRGTHEEGH